MSAPTLAPPRQDVAPARLAGPVWRRLRLWVAVAAVLVVGAVLVGTLSDSPRRPLDPGSAQPDGSRALARVLAGYGTTVRSTTRLPGAGRTVLVTSPDDYSDAQLRELASRSRRLVLIRPGTRATAAVLPRVSPDAADGGDDRPGCAAAGARAAGDVDLPADTVAYRRGGADLAGCYGGAVLVGDRLVIIGSATLLQNDTLSRHGVAGAGRQPDQRRPHRRHGGLVAARRGRGRLRPGVAVGPVPGGAHRAFLWLIPLGLLVVVWRSRRLGSVVTRAAAGGRALGRAGGGPRPALRARRLTRPRRRTRCAARRWAGSRRGCHCRPAPDRSRSPSPRPASCGARPVRRRRCCRAHPPDDDAGLVRLAVELDQLEAAVGGEGELS